MKYLRIERVIDGAAVVQDAKVALITGHAREIAEHVTAGVEQTADGKWRLFAIFPTMPKRMGLHDLILFNAHLAADQADFGTGQARVPFLRGYRDNATGLKMVLPVDDETAADEYKQGWLAYDMDAAA